MSLIFYGFRRLVGSHPVRTYKVYDYATHRWCDFDGRPLTPPLLEREEVGVG
jgi:hypothetical protein